MFTVILNPASGTSTQVDPEQLVSLFRAEGADIRIVLLEPERAAAMIRDALALPSEVVIAGGGDGTVSSVAAALTGSATPLGILPLGTLNHFAKTLHIPLELEQAVKIIAARRVSTVDVGYVNDRAFVNNSSIGIYPSIVLVREELRRQGHRKWTALAIATARVLRRAHEVFVRLDVDGQRFVARTPFVFIGNNEYTVEGIHLGERTRLDTGRLFAYLAPRLHTRDLPKLLLLALLGRAARSGEFKIVSAEEIWIETPQNRAVQVAIDGEVVKLATPLHYRAAPGALRVIVPAE